MRIVWVPFLSWTEAHFHAVRDSSGKKESFSYYSFCLSSTAAGKSYQKKVDYLNASSIWIAHSELFLTPQSPSGFSALSKPVMVLYYLPNNAAADYEFIKEVQKTKQPLYYNTILVRTDLKMYCAEDNHMEGNYRNWRGSNRVIGT